MHIHDSPCQLVLAATGGGAGAIDQLLRYGGGSATVLEALVPYSSKALDELIGKKPEKYVSPVTVRAMAMAAYRRALSLAGNDDGVAEKRLMGVAASCKLSVGDDEREGREHKIFVAIQSFDKTLVRTLILRKERSREEEEYIATCMVVDSIAKECSWTGNLLLEELLCGDEVVEEREATASKEVAQMLALPDNIMNSLDLVSDVVQFDLGGENVTEKPEVIFSGSFDPCHKNHIQMAEQAFNKLGKKVHFEISLTNVDKPSIDLISLQERLDSLRKYKDYVFFGGVLLTVAPLFIQKVNLFEKATFIVGADTVNRLFKTRYYRNVEDMRDMLQYFRNRNTHFLVFQRKGVDLELEPDILDLCEVVPLDDYLDNGTSSTSIRNVVQK
ncbi:hypothetical protein with cytidylyltransferase domain [Methanococcoides burtonii DSM 6242]|uniref:Cytidyltransferase-like domain-containing protein n=2 Tax=Methanococcoides burtonii TaxID=29291 RepID=Q12VZ4_METBU|nr:hypothetical protein with cytidylyltransferase domain [Methanococcoides burtonii DSM 6242]